MTKAEDSAVAESLPEDFLRLALEAASPTRRARYAQEGLAQKAVSADTHTLLLRQLYLAHLEMKQLGRAAQVAREMSRGAGALKDVAHHDAARAFFARGDFEDAIAEQRLAARAAPASRRSFHLWNLATLLHFAGEVESALRALERAERWATRDKTLLRAHAAYIHVAAGETVDKLPELLQLLSQPRYQKGYMQFLRGMIAYHLQDTLTARTHLRAFLRRHAALDIKKELSLREELRRARVVLAELESI